MPDMPPAESLGTTTGQAARAEEARLAGRLVHRRVPDPGERAEVLEALDLPLPSGVYRHHSGRLYQVLFPVRIVPPMPLVPLFGAQWSTNGRHEGRGIAVAAARWSDGTTAMVAWAEGGGAFDSGGPLGVVYVGLSLDGRPKPGRRVRVREAREFRGAVETGGRRVPRFAFVAEGWSPEMGGGDA